MYLLLCMASFSEHSTSEIYLDSVRRHSRWSYVGTILADVTFLRVIFPGNFLMGHPSRFMTKTEPCVYLSGNGIAMIR